MEMWIFGHCHWKKEGNDDFEKVVAFQSFLVDHTCFVDTTKSMIMCSTYLLHICMNYLNRRFRMNITRSHLYK